jgi:signal transduction histidine kinase
MPRASRITAGYALILLTSFIVAVIAGWTSLATSMDGNAYDWMFRVQPPARTAARSMVVAIDEDSLAAYGGMAKIRLTLARLLTKLAGSKAIAIDVILADEGADEYARAQDDALENALAGRSNVILATDLIPGQGRWEEPLERFRRHAAALGHIHAAPDPVSRVLTLEHAGERERRWAMALEAFRIVKGGSQILEEPEALVVGTPLGDVRIPATRETARALYIRYREGIPVIPAKAMLESDAHREAVKGQAVFIGVTAQTAARDRLMTPFERMMSGVEIHAQAFETLMDGSFLEPVSHLSLLGVCALLTLAAGATFAFLSGWAAYAVGGVVLLVAHAIPHIAFSRGLIIPYLGPMWAGWLAVVSAASWQHFVVRRQLRKSESDKARYQQAIHFVTHEMRSPLTAIQGSSELMGRYNLNEEKRRQIAEMINSESKRLARMIQTFLDIERLTDGQTEIRSDIFEAGGLLRSCLERARPLAERKQIELQLGPVEGVQLQGDRELMEYAVYNLLTNAVKYSPPETVVTISLQRDGSQMKLAVKDQGIGMDEKELRNIFQKFYRTKKAETSGEAGTGIGLSIVEQIVTHHGGRMEVTSAPGKGSCFTMVLPAASASRLVSQ